MARVVNNNSVAFIGTLIAICKKEPQDERTRKRYPKLRLPNKLDPSGMRVGRTNVGYLVSRAMDQKKYLQGYLYTKALFEPGFDPEVGVKSPDDWDWPDSVKGLMTACGQAGYTTEDLLKLHEESKKAHEQESVPAPAAQEVEIPF